MIKLVIGLGNPGARFTFSRHNVGFLVLDKVAEILQVGWRKKSNFLEVKHGDLYFVKPQTFMNSSGHVLPKFLDSGIKSQEMLVVHDDLEVPFGKIKFRSGGSAKGHNGLKSIISECGQDFNRISCGISRPKNKEDVPDYVLANFTEDPVLVENMIDKAAGLVLEKIKEDS